MGKRKKKRTKLFKIFFSSHFRLKSPTRHRAPGLSKQIQMSTETESTINKGDYPDFAVRRSQPIRDGFMGPENSDE